MKPIEKEALAALGVVVVAWMCAHFVGCTGLLGKVDDANNPKDDVVLAKCREEGRAVMHDTGDGDKAWNAYYACTVDGGLR